MQPQAQSPVWTVKRAQLSRAQLSRAHLQLSHLHNTSGGGAAGKCNTDINRREHSA